MSIILFSKCSLYYPENNTTVIFGQCLDKFNKIYIENYQTTLVFCKDRLDFYIEIKGEILFIPLVTFYYNSNKVKIESINIYYPFKYCDLQLHPTSPIISTMCKDYSHRLDEWIQYNLNLGFSGIVIFNNDKNIGNDLNEEENNKAYSTKEICKKYKGKVFTVDFDYLPLKNSHWNSIQSISLYIGVNALRTKCRNIALIDADEFIVIPNNPGMKIERFLDNRGTITIKSNILTNKNNDDILDNNILELAKYIGEDKYTKTILKTSEIKQNEFVFTPHEHHTQKVLNKDEIIHYHCWMNKRYEYKNNMKYIDISYKKQKEGFQNNKIQVYSIYFLLICIIFILINTLSILEYQTIKKYIKNIFH